MMQWLPYRILATLMISFVALPSSSFLIRSTRTNILLSTTTKTTTTSQGRQKTTQKIIKRWAISNNNNNKISLEDAAELFQPFFNFPLDVWQIEAGRHIVGGKSTIVCAPTGAGKTVVGEMALRHFLQLGKQGIYTTPLKALSNQKFLELRKLFGSDNVGLSTGDMTINRDAPIVVMTTEVYKNMAWRETNSTNTENNSMLLQMREENRLANVAVVILDEFHYMGLKGRGGVWEESVITSQPHTQIVALSATLPNANRLAQWIGSVTSRNTELVVAKGKRPVPLRYLYATCDGLHPLFRDPDAGPGAPKGLLGLRGDGDVVTDTTNDSDSSDKRMKPNKTKGFASAKKEEPNRKTTTSNDAFPRGLQLHPDLRRRTEQVINKVDRLLVIEERKYQEDNNNRQRSNIGREEERQTHAGTGKTSLRTFSQNEEKRKREQILKREMRRAVPELPILVRRLEQKNILPAIFFIFSRVGCENAAKEVCKFMLLQPLRRKSEVVPNNNNNKRENNVAKDDTTSDFYMDFNNVDDEPLLVTTLRDKDGRKFRDARYISDGKMAEMLTSEAANEPKGNDISFITQHPFSEESFSFFANQGLLPLKAVKEVAARIQAFNQENAEISFNNDMSVQLMMGVSSHHAGQLAAHKSFVESLFQSQQMKVVFATETLAAGINMPARTTVICSMSKRGDGSSMNLLETSNLLQMAGRAGRRGMDSDGTCVLVATPFEGPEEAASILLSEVKPITSQFSPSYALAVNLIARGAGKLGVARDLVQKSFAMWEKRQYQSYPLNSLLSSLGKDESAEDIQRQISQEHFISSLNWIVMDAIEQQNEIGQITPAKLEECLSALASAESLLQTAYSYESMVRLLTLMRSSLGYLQQEAEEFKSYFTEIDRALLGVEADLECFVEDDATHISDQIKRRERRILKNERDVANHPFTSVAIVASDALQKGDPTSNMLRTLLAAARGLDSSSRNDEELKKVTAGEIVAFAKASKQIERKRGALLSSEDTNDSEKEETPDNAFTDILSLIKVLEAYGCLLSFDDPDDTVKSNQNRYEITSAGKDVSLLNFDNSLWASVAVGGAWDVNHESHGLDELQRSLDMSFYVDENNEVHEQTNEIAPPEGNNAATMDRNLPVQEAKELVSNLCCLSASEMAGYVSCLISEGNSRDASNPDSSYISFESLSRPLQYAVRSSILAAERLFEVQTIYGLDSQSFPCNLDLTVCSVVTAWTAGCTWNEALEMSGMAPGDLARVLHRALDALRQFGSLPFHAVRSWDTSTAHVSSCGINPVIRKLCREAAYLMNRYPLKDPLSLEKELIDATEIMFEFDITADNE